jgi:flagellar biosynthesis/type III secretory pathway protein FliH
MAADASAAQMPAAEGQQEPAAAAGAGMLGMHMPPTGVFAKDFEVPISYMGSSSGQFSIVNVIGQVNGVLRDVQELRSCLRLSARHAFGALDEGEPAVPARAQVPLTMKRASTDQRPGESPSAKSAKSAAPGESPSAKSAKSAAMTEKDEAVAISADCKLDEFWQNGSNHGWEKGYGEGYKDSENKHYYEIKDRTNEAWEKGYNTGWEEGNSSGWAHGDKCGYKNVWGEGNKVGYEKGWEEGNQVGYKKGWDEGNDVGLMKGSAMEAEKAFDSGQEVGWKTGYASGQNDGWQDGYNKLKEEALPKGDSLLGPFSNFAKGYGKCMADFHIEGWSPQQLWPLMSIQTAPPYDVPVNDGNGGKGKGTSASAASAGGEAETLVAAVYAEDEHAVVDPEAEHPVVQHEAGVTGDDDRSATTMTPE